MTEKDKDRTALEETPAHPAGNRARPGESPLRERHRPLAVVPCDEESGHNTLAEVVAAGFVERDTGRVRRPLHARFHQYSPGSGETGHAPGEAHSQ